MPATFDFVIARELFYRVADKPAFFAALATALKPGGQIAFTDYIVDSENKQKPAILAWQTHEKGAAPFGLIELAQAWAKVGLELRVSEDETTFYRREIVAGLKRFVTFLAQGPVPDAETKKIILREVELWIYRMAAIEQGMKFYRFCAVRQN
jgi:SAM-dependent methyltransferase